MQFAEPEVFFRWFVHGFLFLRVSGGCVRLAALISILKDVLYDRPDSPGTGDAYAAKEDSICSGIEEPDRIVDVRDAAAGDDRLRDVSIADCFHDVECQWEEHRTRYPPGLLEAPLDERGCSAFREGLCPWMIPGDRVSYPEGSTSRVATDQTQDFEVYQ